MKYLTSPGTSQLELIFVFLALFSLSFPDSLTAKMTQLSGNEMSGITGKDGIRIDFPSFGFTAGQVEYEDVDGSPTGSGNPGVIRFDNFFVGNQGALGTQNNGAQVTNFTLDLNAGNEIVFGFPSSPQLSVRAEQIRVGDPTIATDALFQSQNIQLQDSTLELAGKDDGYNIDLRLDAEILTLELWDTDGVGGSNNSGRFALINFRIGDPGSPSEDSSGQFATFNNIQADVDEQLDFPFGLTDVGGLRFGIPQGNDFGIYVGSVSPASGRAFEASLQNATVRQASWVKVGPDP